MAVRSGGRCGHRGAVFDVLYRPGAVYFAAIGVQLRLLWAAQKAGSGVLGRLSRSRSPRDVAAGGGLHPVARNKRPGHFRQRGRRPRAALVSAGLITALPLLCFAEGARTLRLSTIGMLQYLTPIMQMLWALFVTHEHFSTHRWIGFGIIGVAVAIYVADLVRMARSA